MARLQHCPQRSRPLTNRYSCFAVARTLLPLPRESSPAALEGLHVDNRRHCYGNHSARGTFRQRVFCRGCFASHALLPSYSVLM